MVVRFRGVGHARVARVAVGVPGHGLGTVFATQGLSLVWFCLRAWSDPPLPVPVSEDSPRHLGARMLLRSHGTRVPPLCFKVAPFLPLPLP